MFNFNFILTQLVIPKVGHLVSRLSQSLKLVGNQVVCETGRLSDESMGKSESSGKSRALGEVMSPWGSQSPRGSQGPWGSQSPWGSQ